MAFSVMQTLKSGFQKSMDHIGVLLGSLLVSSAIMGAVVGIIAALFVFFGGGASSSTFSIVPIGSNVPAQPVVPQPAAIWKFLNSPSMFIGFIGFFLVWILYDILRMGYLKIALNITKGSPVSISTLFSSKHLVFRYIVISFIYRAIVAVGCVLFVIPGIIWSIQFGFVTFLLVDKEVGIKEAFSMSSRITSGQKWQLFGLFLITGLITSVASALFGVGLLLAIPFVALVEAVAYREILK